MAHFTNRYHDTLYSLVSRPTALQLKASIHDYRPTALPTVTTSRP